MSKWNVGDEVVIEHKNYGRGPGKVTTETIGKVARKYFYVKAGGWNETAFEIESGREKNNGSSYHAQAYTPDEYQAVAFRRGVLERIREHKVRWGYEGTWRASDWSTGHLCELLALLERVKSGTDQETPND